MCGISDLRALLDGVETEQRKASQNFKSAYDEEAKKLLEIGTIIETVYKVTNSLLKESLYLKEVADHGRN